MLTIPETNFGPLQIDDLVSGEEQACIALWNECGLLVPHNDPQDDIAQFRSAPSSRILVARMGGQVVGSVCVGHDGHRGWLYYLAVKSTHRRRGIARRLLQASESWLRELAIRKVQLMIRPGNQSVANFYERLGYQVTPRTIMAKWLSQELGVSSSFREKAYLDVEITYLEMTEAPSFSPQSLRLPDDCLLAVAKAPTVSFYRYLYNTVGDPWLWWERRHLSDEELKAIISAPGHELHVIYRGGIPAGFGELGCSIDGTIELAYFGLMPEFIGQKLGSPFLKTVILRAWQTERRPLPQRLKVNTCNLDHPRALELYEESGFVISSQETKRIVDPRCTGLFAVS